MPTSFRAVLLDYRIDRQGATIIKLEVPASDRDRAKPVGDLAMKNFVVTVYTQEEMAAVGLGKEE